MRTIANLSFANLHYTSFQCLNDITFCTYHLTGSEEEENKERGEKDPDLFQLVEVNSYGSQEVQKLKDDDKNPLKLSSECMSVYACVCVCVCVCVF